MGKADKQNTADEMQYPGWAQLKAIVSADLALSVMWHLILLGKLQGKENCF